MGKRKGMRGNGNGGAGNWRLWLVWAGILFLIGFVGGALWEHFQESAGSAGMGAEECILCRAEERAQGGIGIWNLHTGQMLVLNGKGAGKGGNSEIDMVAGEDGSSLVARSYGRGITRVQIFLTENSAWEERVLPEGLCASCREKLVPEWCDDASGGYDILLVDLETKEAVQMESRRKAFYLNDYFLHFDFGEDRVDLLIAHAPAE